MNSRDFTIDTLSDTDGGRHHRTFIIAQLIGWCVLTGLMLPPHYTMATIFGATEVEVVTQTVLWGALGLLCSTILGAIYRRLPERILRGYHAVAIVVFLCLVFASVWTLVMTVFESITDIGNWIPDDLRRAGAEKWLVFLAGARSVLMLGTWSAIYLVVLLTRRVRVARERAIQASVLMQEAQLQLLRSQLNPHFLFNALNSVVGLIGEEPRRAQQMVRDLAALLRRTLDSTRKRNATVKDELELLDLYLRCEKVRFEERLQVTVDVDDQVLSRPIPTMLLQPLVENAIKHGMRGREPLRLFIEGRLENRRVVLDVKNSGSLLLPRKTPQIGTGTGLKSVKERLEALFPEDGEFDLFDDHGWVRARIRYTPELGALA